MTCRPPAEMTAFFPSSVSVLYKLSMACMHMQHFQYDVWQVAWELATGFSRMAQEVLYPA